MGTVCQTPCLTQGNSDGCETAPALHLPTSRGRSICTQGDVLTPAGCSVVTGVDGQGTGWAALGKMLEFVRAMGSDSETVTTETGRPGAVTDCHVPGVLGDKGGPRRQGLRRRSQDFVAQASLNSVELNKHLSSAYSCPQQRRSQTHKNRRGPFAQSLETRRAVIFSMQVLRSTCLRNGKELVERSQASGLGTD